MKLSIADIKTRPGLAIYFNWTANVLLPVYTGAADKYFKIHRETIIKTAKELISPLNYEPGTIYRGIILKEPAARIMPHANFKYLSFTIDRKVAENFADINGFGSEIVNISEQLGNYGYIIEHKPAPEDILFHHELLNQLPYMEAFNLLGLNGPEEVRGLMKQKEIVIEQPEQPFTNIKQFSKTIIYESTIQ